MKIPDNTCETRAFTTLVSTCFATDPSKRPNAIEILNNHFFLHQESLSDDDQTGISTTYGSPAKESSFAWEHLLSPATPKSILGKTGRRGGHRRSLSAGCLKSSLLSPPMPESSPMLRHHNSPSPSPRYDQSEWPSWARNKFHEVQDRVAVKTASPKKVKRAQ